MNDTIITFSKLTLTPLLAAIGTMVAVGSDSSITIEFLLALCSILLVVFMAIIAGLWKLSSILSKYAESIRVLERDSENNRTDSQRMFNKLDDLSREVASYSTRSNNNHHNSDNDYNHG